jgi:hypothetical protein
MNGFALLLATALLGVDYGWQPANDGQLEYIVQLEPVALIALREGQEVVSQIDPFVRGVRRFRIRVGTDVVPRQGTPPPQEAAGASPATAAAAPPPGVTYGWQPINEQQIEFLVQIAPERLAILAKEPITGELPAELKGVTRVRIRAGTGNLPRQNLPPTSPPIAAIPQNDPRTAPATRPGEPTAAAAAGLPGSVPIANSPPGIVAGPNTAAPGSSWPPDNRGNAVQQPSRYDPPAIAPATAPAAVAASDPRSLNPPNQPLDTSWSAAQQPPAGGFAAVPPTNPSALNAAPQPGLADPGSQPTWGSGPTAPGYNTSAPAPVSVSPPWGTPDDRYTTDRGQWAGNGAAPAVPTAPVVSPPTGWVPLVSLPPSEIPPPGASSSSMPPYSPWSPSVAGSVSQGEMVSPFFDASTTAQGGSGSLASLTQPPWQTAATGIKEANLSGTSNKKKVPDFWAELAEAANDPSVGFLRDDVRLADSDKPWWPLTLAMLALFASMGGNLYMGWIAVDVYRRYLEMADDSEEDEGESYDSPRDRDERRQWEDRPRRRERAAVED